MTIRSAIWPFPARIKTELQIDPVLLGIVLALLMGGFVILASASISISDNATSNPFFYVQRQLLAAAIGAVAGTTRRAIRSSMCSGSCLLQPSAPWQVSCACIYQCRYGGA